MLFIYKATNQNGGQQEGNVEASTEESAVNTLQRRGLIVLAIEPADKKPWYEISIGGGVKTKDLVVLSRQLATLFEAKVSVLDSFRLLSGESDNEKLQTALSDVANDVQSGETLSSALSKHEGIFSDFYVNMIASGEESGKLSETFVFLADYMERQYELVSKARHAMVYPAFIIAAFIGVMGIMFTVVIPKLSEIIVSSGQEIPLYTKIVIGLSNFFVAYGFFILVALILGGLAVWRYAQTKEGVIKLDELRLATPYVGDLFNKLYISRIADNLDTLLTSGVSMLKALEVTARVVGSPTYRRILEESMELVRGGGTLSQAFNQYEQIPPILVQMLRVGEETGRMGYVLGTISDFYRKEVEAAIETIVALIEPVMIIVLGVGVGILLTSVLLPIYNVAGSIA